MTNEEAIKKLEWALSNNTIYDENEALEYILAVKKGIKALEQSNSDEDCISRKEVIDEIEFFQINPQHFDFVSLIDNIKDLPSIQPKAKWILVSERLPEEDELYLVYTEEQPFVCPFEDGVFFIDDVIAWMPLPEPYKAESEE